MVAIVALSVIVVSTPGAFAQDCYHYGNNLCWKGNIPLRGGGTSTLGHIAGSADVFGVAYERDGFLLYETTFDPLQPNVYGPIPSFGLFHAVVEGGGYYWVADSDTGLVLIDARDPGTMHIEDIIDVPATGVGMSRDYIMCADQGGTFSLVANDPTDPQFVDSTTLPGAGWAVCEAQDLQHAYVACWDGGVAVVDVTTSPPSVVNTVTVPNNAISVCVVDTLLFVGTSNNYFSYGSLEVLSISDRVNPYHIAGVGCPPPWDMSYTDAHIYASGYGLSIFALEGGVYPGLVEHVTMTGQALGGVLATSDYCYVVVNPSWVDAGGVNVLAKPSHSFRSAHTTWGGLSDAADVIAVDGYAYVMQYTNPVSLSAVDLATGAVTDVEPAESGADPTSMTQFGSHILVTTEDDGLLVFEILSPGQVEYVTGIVFPDTDVLSEVATYGEYAYCAGETAVVVVDLQTPSVPVMVQTLDGGIYGSFQGLDVYGDVMYAAFDNYDGELAIRAYDVGADPVDPPVLGELATVADGYSEDLDAVGGIVYVAGSHGLTIADFTDPSDPAWASQLKTGWISYAIEVSGTWAYVVSSDDGVYVVDCADPGDPEIVGHVCAQPPMTDAPAAVALHGDDVLFVDWDAYLAVAYRMCDEVLGVPGDDHVSWKRPELRQNHPNPFNPKTSVSYALPTDGHARVGIYNVAGRLVATLVDGLQTAGEHVAVWNGRTDAGEEAASGVYFCRLETEESHRSIRMVLLK
jgi:hypothetical protein